MLWDGNRQLQEYTDTHVFTTVYEHNSFEPVARLVWLNPNLTQASNDEIYTEEANNHNPIQIYHYHNDQLGTPNELTDNQGNVIWLADYEAWGNTAKVIYTEIHTQQIPISKDELQPIRFQGQTLDPETGLHYNRFRYYDNDIGMFISRDPIGLLGGNNVFKYAPNPTGWIDPFGLNRKYVNLGQGYKGGIDTFDTKGQSNFEIHVFDKKGKEVGMYGPKGWFTEQPPAKSWWVSLNH